MVTKTIKKEILDSVNKVREVVESAGVPVDKIIIFGSQAKGNATPESDIDICVVSKNFGKDDVEEMQWLWKKTRLIDTKIEPYPLSVKDFESGYSPIVAEIKKYGVLV